MKSVGVVVILIATFGYTQAPDTLWTKTYGPSAEGCSVEQLSDRGYMIAGSRAVDGLFRFYLIRTDSLGDTLWTRTYGSGVTHKCQSGMPTFDGGYILGGNADDMYVVKTNSVGNINWWRTYSYNYSDYCLAIKQTADTGYIIAGYTGYYPENDIYVIKTDHYGDTIWTSTFGGAGGDAAYDVIQATDGCYVITGRTKLSGSGHFDVYLMKLTTLGDTVWTRIYDTSSSDQGECLIQTSEGGYAITGQIGSDLCLIKTDSYGNLQWTKVYGVVDTDIGYSIKQTNDGGYIVTGYTYASGTPDLWLLRTDQFGDTLWTKKYGGTGTDMGYSVQLTDDGGYIIAGKISSFGIACDVWLLKMGPDLCIEENGFWVINRKEPLTTVFSGALRLPESDNWRVFDIAGRVVEPSKIQPGIYFIEIDGVVTQKVVKVR